MKAVKITKENQGSLAQQYLVMPEDIPDLLPVGYILVAEFSREWYEGVINQATFDEFFVATGTTLENGYFEVQPK